MAAIEKVFKCLSCQADIKLETDQEHNKWIKYNLDASEHVDEKKKSNNSGAQIAELSKQVSDLKETVNILISPIR